MPMVPGRGHGAVSVAQPLGRAPPRLRGLCPLEGPPPEPRSAYEASTSLAFASSRPKGGSSSTSLLPQNGGYKPGCTVQVLQETKALASQARARVEAGHQPPNLSGWTHVGTFWTGRSSEVPAGLLPSLGTFPSAHELLPSKHKTCLYVSQLPWAWRRATLADRDTVHVGLRHA